MGKLCYTKTSFFIKEDVGIFNFIVVIFSFLFVDLFDTMGTLIGSSANTNMVDENGKLPKLKNALLAVLFILKYAFL